MKLIAKTKDGEIYEVKLQRQFPNCGKYTKCCVDDKEFWEHISNVLKEEKEKLMKNKPPEGFDKW